MTHSTQTSAQRLTARKGAAGIPMGFFGRALLYVSLSCLLNTLFFVPVVPSLPPVSAEQPVGHAAADDPDNSLLELVLEDCFDSPESSSDPQDDVDDVLKKVVYLPVEFGWRAGVPVAVASPRSKLPRIYCIAPLLRIGTPPPEMLA